MKKIIKCLLLCSLFVCTQYAFAQEALKSIEEEYYDFLSLTGVVERPSLGYRTLSDSIWNFNDVESFEENGDGTFTKVRMPGNENDGNLWKAHKLGTKYTLWESSSPSENFFTNGIKQGLFLKVYGPELFNSYNTLAPYGQNDGAFWQGRGYNIAFTAGVRLEGYGFELTVKPQVSWSQNKEFELVNNTAFYTNKNAYVWGYGNNIGADAPQRFGNKAFFNFDFGDSEIRWTWHSFTTGFGTETIWLGPAFQNPLLHSNNAPSYPKFDIGLRKTEVTIPYLDWYIGDFEARLWLGRLTESAYFDEDDTNNHNQITGITLSYAPSFLPGLTLGFNKVCLSKWKDSEFYKYLNIFYGMKGAADGNEVEDQKVSFVLDWLVPKGGIDVYAEFGFDDHSNYSDNIDTYVSHYWHSFTYTFGLKKALTFSKEKEISGEVLFEWNNTEMSQDFYANWWYNFGFHGVISQGYTNKGQWLGSGIGYGGQSQYLGFKLFYPKGQSMFFINRYNPDNNFLFKEAVYNVSTGEDGDLHKRTWNYYKGVLALGLNTNYFATPDLNIGGGITYVRIVNPLYNTTEEQFMVWNNFNLTASVKYTF